MAGQSTAWIGTARMLRRAGFGVTGPDVDAALNRDWPAYAMLGADPDADPGATATPMPIVEPSRPPGKGATPAARKRYNQQLSEQQRVLSDWWLRRMVSALQPTHEKLTLLWHNHFATSAQKIRSAARMAAQNQKLRTLALGDFRTLAYAMLTDAAMLRWLDGQSSTAKSPNENLAREFMELFALGHGNGYTENDVRNGARALTGWVMAQKTKHRWLPNATTRHPRHCLVLCTLYGGNDGINTLIPYADNTYHDARPQLAYAPGDVLHLDQQLGLNPAMKGLAQLWNQRHLAIVRGVSYPQPDHSHFRSMDIWQTASPAEPVSTGWIGRWLDATGDDPLRAVNIGAVLPPLAVGANAPRRRFHRAAGPPRRTSSTRSWTRSVTTTPLPRRRWPRFARPTAPRAPPTPPSSQSNRLKTNIIR